MGSARAWAGLDLGTSGARLCLLNAAGETLHEDTRALPPSRTEGRCSEQSPAHWWRVVRELLECVPAEARIEAIAVDGTSGSVLAIDPCGEPLSDALMYDDARAVAEAARIARVAPPESPANSVHSGLARALWLAERLPPGMEARYVNQADWIAGKLSGRHGFSDETNALKMGYDAMRRTWPQWIPPLLPETALPRVRPVGTPIGNHPDGARVCLGATDSTASVLAACDGIPEVGAGISVLGSTLVVKLVCKRPLFDATRGVYSHRVGDRWLVGGASNSGGAVLATFFTREQIEQLSRRIDPTTPSPLDYYPLRRPGERFPRNAPSLAPRLSPRPGDDVAFLHGMLEGIARIEAEAYALLARATGTPLKRVVSIGGGAANPTWRAIRERRLGVSVERARHRQAARGAALIALRQDRSAYSFHGEKGNGRRSVSKPR